MCREVYGGGAAPNQVGWTSRVTRRMIATGEVDRDFLRRRRNEAGICRKSGYRWMMPRRIAIVTACVRSVAPSFNMMCLRCAFTVSSEMNSRVAMS
jgi:hypothetical protein